MSATSIRSLRDLRLADASEVGGKAAGLGRAVRRWDQRARWRRAAGSTNGTSAAERIRCWPTAQLHWVPGHSRCVPAASPRTGPNSRSPACTNRCWTCRRPVCGRRQSRSWRAPRRRGLRATKWPGDGRMAVIVQRMVAPAAAGVAFTADPVNGDRQRDASSPPCAGSVIGWCRARPSATSGSSAARQRPNGAASSGALDRRARRCSIAGRGTSHRGRPRDAAGRRMGDRRGRRALDPPGPADDGAAARRLLGRRRRRAPTPASCAWASGSASR